LLATFPMNPSYDEIVKANSMRGNEIKKTPLIHSPTFSNLTGSEIYLKAEFRQKTGSFKARGAYYKIKSLSDEEKKHGVVAASAGAASLAYLISKKPAPGKKVVAVLAGGNVDMYLLGQIVDKGLAAMGRLLKLSILLPDRPGAFKEIVDEVTLANANIVEVIHDRLSSNINAGSAGVTLSLETQGKEQADLLIEALRKKNVKFTLLT